jgi:hypothetical protein
MKKIILFALLATTFSSYGQSIQKSKKSSVIGHDDENSFMISLGTGANNVESIPFYLNMDYFATNDLSFGYQMIFGGQSETINNWKYGTINYSFGLTANYHLNTLFNISYNWDLYLGANGGYNLGTTTPKDWNAPDVNISSKSKFYGGGQIGLRYYVTNVLSLNVEGTAGSFRSGVYAGISLKF